MKPKGKAVKFLDKGTPTEVVWEGTYGCIDEYKYDENGNITAIAVTGVGVSFYPMCPQCREYALQEDNFKNPDGTYTCWNCGQIQKEIDWNKRPATIMDED